MCTVHETVMGLYTHADNKMNTCNDTVSGHKQM